MDRSRYVVNTVAELDSLTRDLKTQGYTVITFAPNLRELKKDDHYITIVRDKHTGIK